MLVRTDGTCVGSVSGGCLEVDVIEHARELFANSAGPRQLVYDTTVPDDRLFGTGSGCKGRVTILLELVPPFATAPADDWLSQAEAALKQGTACVVATLVDGPAEWTTPRTLLASVEDATDKLCAVFGISLPPQGAEKTAFLPSGEPGKPLTVFVQRLEPPPLLLICGAGPTARPLAAICTQMGWTVKVIDWRKALLNLAPFPPGTRVEHVPSWSAHDFSKRDDATAAVVMTHRWEEDCAAMRGLLQRRLVYLGLMGSHKRCAELLDTLEHAQPDRATKLVVDAPAGVTVGAEGPAEIAIAIAARLIAAIRQKHSDAG